MVNKKVKILETAEVERKIKRIAYQIYEENHGEDAIVLAGIPSSGYYFAQTLQQQLQAISPLKVHLIRLDIDKEAPNRSPITHSELPIALNNRVLIIVDDVLNTGKTLFYGITPFLEADLKSLQTAVLVNRSHLEFPIAATYTGLELSTTFNEHIEVVMEEECKEVFLR